MAICSWCKKRELLQCRKVENQHRDVAESEEIEDPDVASLPNDVAAFEVGFDLWPGGV